MSRERKKNELVSNLSEVLISALTSENLQVYLLGTKKSGKPRSVYDIVKETSRKKKKKDKNSDSVYSIYRDVKKGKKKKGKKGKKSKHWRFD